MVVDTTPTYDAQPPSRCEEMLNNKLNQFSKYDREGTACHYPICIWRVTLYVHCTFHKKVSQCKYSLLDKLLRLP